MTASPLQDDSVIEESKPYPYSMRLADGRHLFIELPPGSVTRDPDGELVLRPQAARLIDRMRVMARDLPDRPTPGWIRTLREALGLTQREMGERAGVDKLSVSRWERGEVRPGPGSVEALRRLRKQAARRGVVMEE